MLRHTLVSAPLTATLGTSGTAGRGVDVEAATAGVTAPERLLSLRTTGGPAPGARAPGGTYDPGRRATAPYLKQTD